MKEYETQSDLLKTLAHSTRLAILDILRDGEQCVCHMEAMLGMRQAYISQQLMILKQAGLVEARRDGLNLYYHIIKPEVFTVLDALKTTVGISTKPSRQNHRSPDCSCPKCNISTSEIITQVTSV